MKYTIYSSAGVKRTDFEGGSKCTHEHKIQTENVLNLSFTIPDYIELDVNDYIDIEGTRFVLMKPYKPNVKSTKEYVYDIKFYGPERIAATAIFLDAEYRPITSYYDTPVAQLSYIVSCINRVIGSDRYHVGTVVGSEPVEVSYNKGCTCLEALSALSAAIKTEWWLDGVNFNLSKCEFGEPVVLGYNKGLLSLTKEITDAEEFYTRLIPLGSTKNIIPSKYGHQTLQLPGGANYVDRDVSIYGIKEKFEEAAFADIFPSFTGTVSSVRTETRTIEGIERTIYYITDPDIPFNPDEYSVPNTVKHVIFKDGDLNGKDFEANWNWHPKEWELILQYPTDSTQLPGGNVIPRVGDTYTVYNLDMPDEYYALAEQKYLAAVNEMLDEHAIDFSTYKAPTDHVYLEKNNIKLAIGRRIRLESNQYFPSGYRDGRITRVVRKLSNLDDMDVEVGNTIIKTSYGVLKEDVSDLKTTLSQQLAGEVLDIVRTISVRDLTDDNILSSLRTLKEIKNRSISRLTDDEVAGVILFLAGLKSLGNIDIGDFIGGLTGQGARIKPSGDIEARSLVLWEFLQVPELRYNRAEVIAGTSWRTKGGGIIESVTVNEDGISGTVHLKLEDGDIGRVSVDDLCLGIWHYESGNETDNLDDGVGNYRFAGFGSSYFRISSVRGARNAEFDFTMRPISDNYTKQFLPQSGMHFAQFGNPTDELRQSSVYETPEYTRRLVGVTTWEYSSSNISLQIGDLSNLSIFGINVDSLGSLYANNVTLYGRIDQSAHIADRIDFSSDNGLSISSGETTTVTAIIMNTWMDVTKQYERFDWTRDSGYPVEDAAWNALHTDIGSALTLSFSEILSERNMFTVTAYKQGVEPLSANIII